jgi:hypothetical protein
VVSFQIRQPHDRILHALAEYQYLSARQVQRLFYGPGSKEEPQRLLKQLADAGYVYPIHFTAARLPYIYRLARKGLNYCRDLGLDVFERFNAGEEADRSPWSMRHTIAISDALIGLTEAARSSPRFGLERMVHERVLKRTHKLAVEIVDPQGVTTASSYVPDAWFALIGADSQSKYRQGYCLEIDFGTEAQRAFGRKLDRILAAAAGPYRRVYGPHRMRVAIIVAGGPNPNARLMTLVRWTEAALKAHTGAGERPRFFFTYGNPAETPGDALYLAQSWREPDNPQLTWLVEEVHRDLTP